MVRPAFFDCVTSNSVVGNTIEHFFHLDCLSGKLGHRKFVVVSGKLVKENEVQEPYNFKRCLADIIKAICYLSVIIPAAFLFAKALYRRSRDFTIIAPVSAFPKEPSLTREEMGKIANDTPKVKDQRAILEPFYKKINGKIIVCHNTWDVSGKKEAFEKNTALACEFMKKLFEQDVIAFSIGYGKCEDQMWPKPVVDEIFRNKSVLNVFFERESPIYGFQHWQSLHIGNDKCDEFLLNHLDKVHVEQFQSGFPVTEACAEGTGTFGKWTLNQAKEFQANFINNVEQALARGKKVYFGYYPDGQPKGFLLDLYNRMKVLYPNQIYLMIAHEGLSMVAVSTVTEEQAVYVANHRDEATRKQYANVFGFFNNLQCATV